MLGIVLLFFQQTHQKHHFHLCAPFSEGNFQSPSLYSNIMAIFHCVYKASLPTLLYTHRGSPYFTIFPINISGLKNLSLLKEVVCIYSFTHLRL